jgi:fumarate reductase flavoprotein subunit
MISRAMITEFEQGLGFQGRYGEYMQLDLRHLGEDHINKKLPFVRELAENYIGVDPVKEPIPIRPVVHYMMGGVRSDIDGVTRLQGLFACGECAQEGLNGANRLGSNSLTECLVFGHRTGRVAAQYAQERQGAGNGALEAQANDEERRITTQYFTDNGGNERVGLIRADLQQAMERNVGVFRTGEGLQAAIDDVRGLKERFRRLRLDDKSRVFNTELMGAMELENLLDCAETVVHPALLREESRGSQARRDFPNRDDQRFLAHSLAFKTDGDPRIEWEEAVITKWEPEERKY